MTFLSTFTLPDEDAEWDFFIKQKSRAYSTYYPFQIFPQKQVPTLTFEPITIFYGDNGSGKSTLLNVIAEKLGLARGTLYNRSSFEADYLTLCNFELAAPIPDGSAIISSDEVFDAMLNTRALNQQIDRRRDDMFDDYLDNKFASFHYHDLSDYDELKKILETRSKTQSRYVRDNLAKNAREFSNGESALQFFQDKLQDQRLYLLDEPENSLSPANQQKLAAYLTDRARFFGNQFVIATHSPFLLALPHTKIYDLDKVPVASARWQELPEVQTYAQFFTAHAAEFKKESPHD
ncbi:AAA family ATPase [Lacticaseibacillus camelliae]|uniref:AAA+ ATPase domain-containing protein n=1 Tax=Lacticaseibacillus camelliae DSM 22697 = JCM 13995 TaxID=1423730 RepID=A0A0R2FHC9_9LACO|nr:AAA family ATPase [Lacticaseibacillus camelliae]KRN24503.1 hypothetical protein FC75_GL001306 [Lacticaseibacillus camelliae DSM 22697 = JCM 13995]